MLLGLRPSRAEAQSAEEQAAAEALFREGRRLLDEGHTAQACRKFEASYELDVALGTLLNLAACLEQEGRLASAWARFVEAETRSRRAGSRERQQVAHARAAALESRLVRLRLVVPSPTLGMRIDVSGREFAPALWNTPIPVDPGEMTITASAEGYETWTYTVPAQEEGTTVEVEVPALTPAPPSEEPAEVAPEEAEPLPMAAPLVEAESPRSVRRIVGYTLGGVGVAALGASLGLTLSARSLWNSADCTGGICGSAQAQDDAETARSRANVATGMVVTGGALAATAIIVLVTGHRGDDDGQARIRVTPTASLGGGGLSVGGSF
jgi:hypothetical protein